MEAVGEAAFEAPNIMLSIAICSSPAEDDAEQDPTT
jgi:hypothetical protein